LKINSIGQNLVKSKEKSSDKISIFIKTLQMSFYKKLARFAENVPNKHRYYRWFFNLSPMYKRSCGKLIEISPDFYQVKAKIKFSYRNVNYMGTMFAGSMLSATDPIYMIQLTEILGKEYVVWDKGVSAKFKRPVKTNLWVDFIFTKEEVEIIKNKVKELDEYTFVKPLILKDKKDNIYATLDKEIYVSTYKFYKEKLALRNQEKIKNQPSEEN